MHQFTVHRKTNKQFANTTDAGKGLEKQIIIIIIIF